MQRVGERESFTSQYSRHSHHFKEETMTNKTHSYVWSGFKSSSVV